MPRKLKITQISIVVLLWATMLFSCSGDGNLEGVKKLEAEIKGPQSQAKNINLFYTDSGVVKANLRSPKMLDFTQEKFPYREFPDGVEVDFFDDDSTKNTVVSDYAIIYLENNLIDLRKNVKITTSDSTILNSDQLYWNQDEDWLFTDHNYTIKMANGTFNDGQGFDANQNFDKFNSRTNEGIQYINEEE
ncbi:MAG: LPS export ABC transporter periplasmic protein LptC [Bacteroidota bacterium]